MNKQEFGDYLIAHGYEEFKGLQGIEMYYFKGDKAVVIRGDIADFMILQEGEENQRKTSYSRYNAFLGISSLSVSDWIQLMHITGIVSLKQFINAVRHNHLNPKSC